jgi:hypothetical protein
LIAMKATPGALEEANRARPAAARHGRSAGRGARVPAEPATKTDPAIFLEVAAVSCLFSTGIIHVVWAVMHFDEWLAAGIFFLAVAALQTVGAFAVAAIPGRTCYLANVAVNAVTVVVWAVSRTTGIPVGPDAGQRAAVGMPDLVATLLELVIVLALFPLLRGRSAAGRGNTGIGLPSRRAQLALVGIPCYTLVLTCVAVVPAAAGHIGH